MGLVMDDTNAGVIIRGDSLEVLPLLADMSVDAVITDPPYFIDGMGDNWSNRKLRSSMGKAGVVGSLPVGMKFDPEQGKRLEKFMYDVSVETMRVLKPGGFYLAFSQPRLYHRLAVAMEDAGFEIRDMLVWAREGQAKAFSQDHFVRKMDLPDEEKQRILDSLHGRKTPQLKGQHEPIVLAQKPREGTFINNWLEYGVGLVDTTASIDGRFPGTIMSVPKPHGEERKASKHITLKPVRLMEHLVQLFTKPGDIVLDPFLGSGTTAEACVNTGRRYVGVELTDEFYNESVNRVRTHTSDSTINTSTTAPVDTVGSVVLR